MCEHMVKPSHAAPPVFDSFHAASCAAAAAAAPSCCAFCAPPCTPFLPPCHAIQLLTCMFARFFDLPKVARGHIVLKLVHQGKLNAPLAVLADQLRAAIAHQVDHLFGGGDEEDPNAATAGDKPLLLALPAHADICAAGACVLDKPVNSQRFDV